MRPLPPKLRSLLDAMPRMRTCEARWSALGECYGRIQWHHVWTYGDKGQINEHWAILGACELHHRRVKEDKKIKEVFERRSLEIASDKELAHYPRKDWNQLKKYLHAQKYPNGI